MINQELLAAQAEMRERNKHPRRHITYASTLAGRTDPKLQALPKKKYHCRSKAEIQAERELKATLKRARALRRKKKASHKRYLRLKKERGTMTRAMRAEWQALCADSRALRQEMKETEQVLNRLNRTVEVQRALGIAEGYRLAMETQRPREEEHGRQKN